MTGILTFTFYYASGFSPNTRSILSTNVVETRPCGVLNSQSQPAYMTKGYNTSGDAKIPLGLFHRQN
ncbi:hypothetical protein CC2G_006663 [Coprinopsis cinerea AmutBmut pab1-1]|nr:hypothetical protein CC2G_006663 [Coprinopsis cinerea AmutBmut pab1-1]